MRFSGRKSRSRTHQNRPRLQRWSRSLRANRSSFDIGDQTPASDLAPMGLFFLRRDFYVAQE